MKQYQDLLRDIMDNGIWKAPAREGMPRTKEVFCRQMRFNLSEGFPLLTTKKIYTRATIAELLWFLRGDTNIKYLVDNNVHIWDADCYKLYKRQGGTYDKDRWLESVKSGDISLETGEQFGECGHIYGWQWRHEGDKADDGNGFDQINNLLYTLKHFPESRYQLVTAWSPSEYLGKQFGVALPACVVMFQCCVNNGKLDMMVLQRSCDTFLGVPFDIASYALLTHLLAAEIGVEPGELIWIGNCCHIYENHIDQVNELLSRTPRILPKLVFNKRDSIYDYKVSDFSFEGYDPYPVIKAPLSVGV